MLHQVVVRVSSFWHVAVRCTMGASCRRVQDLEGRSLPQVVIENPVLNSPFDEPTRHFKFGDDGITDEIVESRRVSSYFVPIPAAKKKGKQLVLDTEWTIGPHRGERVHQPGAGPRRAVARGRPPGRHPHHEAPARLLGRSRSVSVGSSSARSRRWRPPSTWPRCAGKLGDAWIENQLREPTPAANPDLYRIAFKMATGSGKTVVMAMLIAWQALNKLANPQDARFGDTFLIVTPGITIRDRLRVLLPHDPGNYYRGMDVVPAGPARRPAPGQDPHHQLPRLPSCASAWPWARSPRASSPVDAARGKGRPFTETPDQMVAPGLPRPGHQAQHRRDQR